MARILLAEDDDTWRRFFTVKLQRAGHDVDPVDNGLKALDRLHWGEYDLLLADIVMPGLDGIELARKATGMKPALRIMFITGFSGLAMGQRGIRPDTKILSKPFHLNELVDQVDRFLESGVA